MARTARPADFWCIGNPCWSRALDVRAADHGHCLVIDIRASYGRSKRRLLALATVQEPGA